MSAFVLKRGKSRYVVVVDHMELAQRCSAGHLNWIQDDPKKVTCSNKNCKAQLEGSTFTQRRKRWNRYSTLGAAKEACATLSNALREGSYVGPSKATLREFFEKWLESTAATVKPTTLESYRCNIETHIIPRLGSKQLQALRPSDLNAFYAQMLSEGRHGQGTKRVGKGTPLSPKTVRNCHVVLRKALGDAVRWGDVARNVAILADPPKLQRKAGTSEMKTWSRDELTTFLEYVKEHDERLYAAWVMFATTGVRRGELLALRWDDLDLATGRLSIRRGLVAIGYKPEISTPKNGKARVIDLDAHTLSVLRAHRTTQIEERFVVGPGWNDQGWIFCQPDGNALHPDRCSQMFDLWVRKSGVPRIRLHDVRHTWATLALGAGVPVKVVSERLGHASSSFTSDVYQHVTPGMQADAAAKVAGLIFGGS